MPSLHSDHIERMVSLVEPFCRTENERIVLIDTIFAGAPGKPDIDIHGAPGIFTRRLIHHLMDYGTVAPDSPALWILLDGFVRGQVGVDKQAQIDDLRVPIFAAFTAQSARSSHASSHVSPLLIVFGVIGIAALVIAAGVLASRSTSPLTDAQETASGTLLTHIPSTNNPTNTLPATVELPTSTPSNVAKSTFALPTLDTASPTVIAMTSSAPPIATTSPTRQGRYPCTAVVRSPSGATLLNVVRDNPSTHAPPTASIRRGDTVNIQRESLNQGTTWYFIESLSGVELGWVETQYLARSLNCP